MRGTADAPPGRRTSGPRPIPRDALVTAPMFAEEEGGFRDNGPGSRGRRTGERRVRQRGGQRVETNAETNTNAAKNKKKEKQSKGSGKKEKEKQPMASFSDLFSFLETPGTKLLFATGCISGFLNGLVYPILAYMFSNSFSNLGGASDGLGQVRSVAFDFLAVGAYAFAVATVQTSCVEIAASRATLAFRKRWFAALLRQDAAFFDVNDVGGLASTVGPNSDKVRRGLGRKFGEGVQFGTTFVAGLAYAFYASWRVALVIIGVLPFVSVSALAVMKINQGQTARAAEAYSRAGSVAYSTVSAIRTVLSLNAVPQMIKQYSEATLEAYRSAVGPLWKQGFVNGSMLGSFICLYCILTLYGTMLLYNDVRGTGCDPSAGVPGAETCGESGPSVFGAMLGAAFAAQGLSQVANVIEAVTAARVACAPAMVAIRRTVGAPAEEIVVATSSGKEEEEEDEWEDEWNENAKDTEVGAKKNVTAILPKYVIDSSSPDGLRPKKITGSISFKGVGFAYPTRPNNPILDDFNLDIKAGTTVALVGPSGGGKSTTVSLIERFYDPTSGTVQLNGFDLKLMNVKYLREQIGYVGQEPMLFATSIAGNIQYGDPNATQAEIEAAARMANAHEFITSFPDGYKTQVGDKGAQLSGGQKQRIAIARVLVANPKVLLLDEATSALDSESELVVQEALDRLLMEHKRTTIIIAHRLTTIRNADVIAVIAGGKLVEKGSHEELMVSPIGHYRNLVEKQGSKPSRTNSEADLNRRESYIDLEVADGGTRRSMIATHQIKFRNVSFAYPTRSNKLIMDGFNLSVRRGETLALVGPSGGGKSTTVSMIERFYDPIDGIVEFEGIDIRELNVKWLRDQIGFVQQEPILFNASIADNIRMGFPDATQSDIIEACRMANALEFIQQFPESFNTEVGERGTQLSGGQKQRIAIARALVKRPKVLLLDEATSALDTDSEHLVQEALDEIMASHDRTTIVIAHRLSTIRNADRIAFIANGRVREIGSHDELMAKPRGRYRRLVESQKRGSSVDLQAIKDDLAHKMKDDGGKDNNENVAKELEEDASKAFDAKEARNMAKPDLKYLLAGGIGAIVAGGVFPAWGIMFALMIELLFQRVEPCPREDGSIPGDNIFIGSCEDYQEAIANNMRETSFELAGYWAIVCAGCLIGNALVFWGFGMASERLNKRVRDSAFGALVRQEVSFFDKQSVGSITTQLQDDAARIHTFSGEPIRTLLISLSSVITGITVSFVAMWPFALVSLATIPFMGFATSIEMKTMMGGVDEGTDGREGLDSPGGIVVETLLNIRTVAALNMEKQRHKNYVAALQKAEPRYVFTSIKSGMTSGLSMIIQQWSNALQFWWGGWLLFNYPEVFTFEQFLISMFALLFSLFALGAAAMGASDKKECEKSAGRIFYLTKRQSAIDPLSKEGKIA